MRLLVYDRTEPRLTRIWRTGAGLYRRLGRIDAAHGVASWDEALAWLGGHDTKPNNVIDEIQYWGHGKWGRALVDADEFDASSITGPRRKALEAIRERLAPDALVWFRTCETFGAKSGHDFAQRLADFLGARVAGHTYVIAFHQSGLHGLAPGMRPDWSVDEGLIEGTADDPRRARWSRPWSPNTISCLTSRVPPAWFAR